MTKGKLAPSSPVLTTPKRRFPAPSFHHPVMGAMIIGIAFIVALAIPAGIVSPQQAPYVHLNPVVEKLAQGKPIIGTQTADYSMANCRSLSRLNLDYVYLDME